MSAIEGITFMKDCHTRIYLCLLILLVLTQVSCDTWIGVEGNVYDSQNNPVENATVQLKIVGTKEDIWQKTVKTDRNGKFALQVGVGPFNDDLRLLVAKDGYKIYETEFSSRQVQKNQSQFDEYKIVIEKTE